MGKRSNFERIPKDKYYTPKASVLPLLPHLKSNTTFFEPCAGDGRLIAHLEEECHICKYACDIEPEHPRICKRNALEISHVSADCVITNPPWDRKILHPIIEHFAQMVPTWLLFDADWVHTKQSASYMQWCSKIISVGRVKWIENSKMTGKDNVAWYLFEPGAKETVFVPRSNVL